MNLNDIYKHLSNNEILLDGQWVESTKSDFFTTIDSLSQLIFQAIQPSKANQSCDLQKLRKINEIEDFIKTKYGKDKNINFNWIKSSIIHSIAKNTLCSLENIIRTSENQQSSVSSALEGLEEIWNQRNYEVISPTSENNKISDIERNIIRLIDSEKIKKLLTQISSDLNLTKVSNYLNYIESVKIAVKSQDLNLLKKCIESTTLPLNTKVDLSGNTILHLVSNWPDAIQLLLSKNPALIDEPNNKYEFPSITHHLLSQNEKQLELRPVKTYSPQSVKNDQQLQDDKNLNTHPNSLMMIVNDLILNSDDPYSESIICKKLEDHPEVIQGQRGKNLLCSAIQSKSFPLVKKLLDLGVSPKGIYGLPLSSSVHVTSTPLHQAILNEELAIASLLIERGADVNAGDQSEKSIKDHIQSKVSLSSNYKISRWIELQTAHSDELKQHRFKKACDSKNWPELTLLIHQGFNPGEKINQLLSGMVRDGQFYLIKLLIEKDYIKSIEPRTIEEILLIVPPSFIRWFLTTLIEKKFVFNLSSLLEAALGVKDYALAAFLITLGAKPGEKDARALNHYAEALKKGTETEKRLRKLINVRNIGHLVGDTIITQMKNDDDTDLEGNTSGESLEFFKAALDLAIEENPQLVSPALIEFSHTLKNASTLALRIDSIRHLGNDRLIANGLELLEADLIDEVNKLPIGKSVVIPTGWSSGNSGHAIIVECKRLTEDILELNVINTGEGINYHGITFKKAKAYAQTVRSYVLSNKQLRDHNVLRRLVEPIAFSDIERRFFPEDVYGFLEPFHTSDKKIPNDLEIMPKTRKAQLSGTCSLRCWLAYSKLKFPAEYKLIKEVLNEKVISFAIEQNQMILDKQPALTRLLNLSMPVLLHTLSKNLSAPYVDLEQKEKQLIKLTSSSLNLQKATLPAHSENKISLLTPFFATASKQISTAISTLIKQPPSYSLDAVYEFFFSSSKTKMEMPIRLMPLDINQITSVAVLENYLETLGKSIQIPNTNVYDHRHRVIENGLTGNLISLGRALLPDSPETSLKKVLESLKDNPEACQSLIGKIHFLTNRLCEAGFHRKTDNIAYGIALQYALIASWELGCHIDKNLNKYTLDLSKLKTWIEYAHPKDSLKSHPILNAEIENDLKLLFEYSRKQKLKKIPTLLNMGKINANESGLLRSQATTQEFWLKKDKAIADLNYAAEKAKKHKNWVLADSKYYMTTAVMKLASQIPDISLEEWRIYWFYFFGLPPYFQQMQDLAVLASKYRIGFENHSAIKTRSLTLKITEDQNKEKKTICYPVMSYHFKHDDLDGKLYLSELKTLPNDTEGLKLNSTYMDFAELSLLPCSNIQSNIIDRYPNLIDQELMSIRTAIESSNTLREMSPLVVPLLLDFFTQHLSELSKLKIRIFFEMSFFSSLCLPKAIREIPNCADDIKTFFQTAFSYFEERISQKVEKRSSLEALAFLYTQWQRTLIYFQQEGVSHLGSESTADLLKNTRVKIKELLKDPDFKKNELQQQLLLGLLDSYHGEPVNPKTLVKDVITSITTYYNLVASNNEGDFLVPAFLNSALSIPIKFHKLIHDTLLSDKKFTNTLFNEIVLNYGIKVPKDSVWNIQNFPICQCQFNQELLEIDIFTGRLLHNGEEIMTLSHALRNSSKSYMELFGEKSLIVTNVKTHLKASDELGEILIFTEYVKDSKQISEIRRKINGKWYVHIPTSDTKSYPPLPSLIGKENLNLWVSQEGEKHYLLADKKTLTPTVRLDFDGRLTFLLEDPNTRWECVDKESLKNFGPVLALDPSAFMLQEDSKDIPRRLRLQLPNLTNSAGENIEFERLVSQGSAEPRWVMKNKPHLFISKEQSLPGIRNFNQFLIIENLSGNREALIPIKTKKQIDQKDTVNCSCISVNLKGNTLSSPDSKTNIYLAYLSLIHAKTPEDYEIAMKFLKCARKFESYNLEELRLLGWIFHSQKMTSDATVQAGALKLFASWLVQENFNRNPDTTSEQLSIKPETLEAMSEPIDWLMFWKQKLPKEDLFSQIETLAHSYFARQQHLPFGMRMQDILTTQELIDWKLHQFILEGQISAENKDVNKVKVSTEDINLLNDMQPTRHQPQILVPGRPLDSLENEFTALLHAALSQDPETRAIAEKQLVAMRFAPDSEVFSAILAAALKSHENEDARNVVNLVYKIINTPSKKIYNPSDYSTRRPADHLSITELAEELENLLMKSPSYFSPLEKPDFDFTPDSHFDIFPPMEPTVLPAKIPHSKQLQFTPSTSLNVPRFERLFQSAFEVMHQEGDIHIEPFEFKTKDPWLNQSIENINADYLAGAEKNQQIPHYRLKNGKLENLIDLQYSAIAQEATHYSEKVITSAGNTLLKLANTLPSDKNSSLRHKLESASGRKKTLSIQDCILLFLRGDLETYELATQLSEREINELHNLIGNYILISSKANRYKEVLKSLETIKKIHQSPHHTQKDLEAPLQYLAEELCINKSIDPVRDPRAFMVFEYVLNMTLKSHQVEGLRDMIETETGDPSRYRSVLLQRIQGGGKSLVFGHIMAHFKADGYHLSVHIPTTAQYQTSLYDMSSRSEQLYQQRERTLVFDDDPLKFTKEYLTWIKEMLKGAIVNREYLTLTNETLRALRCKYLKTRFEILKSPQGTDVSALEEKNQILKEILVLLKTRGIFTFDEMHKAFDPLKELNMPYGLPGKPINAESRLISQIIILACLPNAEGKLWIDLEHSSQQSEKDFKGMIEQIISGLLSNPSWNQPGIKEYLSGKIEDLPRFLEMEGNEDLMKLVILARQMLAGNWLKERLSTNVNEHHGISPTGVRVSIPFLANMKPAIGSEFTDPYVMTINTMIAYLVTGLDEQQTLELLESFRQRAEAERRTLAEKSHFIALSDTPSSLAFKKITGLDLFQIDREKQEDIHALQTALMQALKQTEKNKKHEAMNFLLDHIINKEINQVELYENQVCSNGQNVASMCKSFVAYSGSMENLNMAPVGSIAKPESGTNGQSIDLLIKHKTQVQLVKDGNLKSLFKIMKEHPRSRDILAIMDVGAFFRGLKNEIVAKMLCEYLAKTHPEIQGVLFFDTEKENLCFMQRDPPHTVKQLSMTTPEAIKSETGFEKNQLFTYYDQVHTTGVDIAQDDNTIGIFTMNEHTTIHEILQAVRRLRKLDQRQRLLTALPEGIIKNIEAVLKKSYRPDEAPTINDLLLYANIMEVNSQKGENLTYCLQKMENIIQQYILDKMFEMDIADERSLFEKCAYLFEKNVAIDLHKEFAHKREACSMSTYLETIKQAFLQPLNGVLSSRELDLLNRKINTEILKDESLQELDATINVPKDFSQQKKITASVINPNRTSTRVQSKQQIRSNEKMQVSEQENLTEFLNEIESRRLATSYPRPDYVFTKQQFFSKDFGNPLAKIDLVSNEPCCWDVTSALQLEKTSFPTNSQFDKGLTCTNNAAITLAKHINLTGPYRKRSRPLLVICDTDKDGKKRWQVVLCSIEDAVTFDNFLKPKIDGKKWTINSRGNREMWLVRSKGNLIAGASELDLDNNPQLSLLMTQALFLEGDFETLSTKPWRTRLNAWFSTLDTKASHDWIHFFEEEILMGFPPGYKSSYLYDYFHPK